MYGKLIFGQGPLENADSRKFVSLTIQYLCQIMTRGAKAHGSLCK